MQKPGPYAHCLQLCHFREPNNPKGEAGWGGGEDTDPTRGSWRNSPKAERGLGHDRLVTLPQPLPVFALVSKERVECLGLLALT